MALSEVQRIFKSWGLNIVPQDSNKVPTYNREYFKMKAIDSTFSAYEPKNGFDTSKHCRWKNITSIGVVLYKGKYKEANYNEKYGALLCMDLDLRSGDEPQIFVNFLDSLTRLGLIQDNVETKNSGYGKHVWLRILDFSLFMELKTQSKIYLGKSSFVEFFTAGKYVRVACSELNTDYTHPKGHVDFTTVPVITKDMIIDISKEFNVDMFQAKQLDYEEANAYEQIDNDIPDHHMVTYKPFRKFFNLSYMGEGTYNVLSFYKCIFWLLKKEELFIQYASMQGNQDYSCEDFWRGKIQRINDNPEGELSNFADIENKAYDIIFKYNYFAKKKKNYDKEEGCIW